MKTLWMFSIYSRVNCKTVLVNIGRGVVVRAMQKTISTHLDDQHSENWPIFQVRNSEFIRRDKYEQAHEREERPVCTFSRTD